MRIKKPDFRGWTAAIGAFAADRALKMLAVHALSDGPVTCLHGILTWALVRNRGAAFSMLSGNALLLTIVTPLICACLAAYLLFGKSGSMAERVGLWLIVGGGLGNLCDRVFLGYVIDFIRPDFVRFATFNPADVFICVGAVLTCVSAFAAERKKEHDPHE